MLNVKYILRNINLLNILLIVAILVLINYTILPLFNMGVRITLPSVKNPPVHKDEKTAEITIPSLTDYTLIADENLFHPERMIPTHEAEVTPEQKPEFVLYGVVITDDTKLAYLEDLKSPYSTVGRGKRQQALHLGSTLSGYILQEIYPDKVVMAKGEDRLELRVTDFTRERAQDKKTTKPQVPQRGRSAMQRKAAQSLSQSLETTKQRGTSVEEPVVSEPSDIPRNTNMP